MSALRALIDTDRQSELTRPGTIMSLEAARDLSIQDLFCVLNEKLDLECTRIHDISPSRPVPAAYLESEVSTRQPILIPTNTAAVGSDTSGLYRSTASKPKHTIF